MKHVFVFLLLTMFSCIAKAQLVLGITNNSPKIEATNFYIAKVTDSTQSSLIGLIHNNDGIKQVNVSLCKSSTQSVFYRLVQKNAKAYPIEMVVKKVNIVENKIDKLLEGEFTLVVDFYSKQENQRDFLLTATAKQNYKRSLSEIKSSSLDLLLLNNIKQTIQYLDQWISQNQHNHPAFATTSMVTILKDYTINHADTVYHASRPLVWDDFQGKPNNSYAASIFSSIAYTMEMTVDNNTVLAKITPKVYMVRGISWVKPFAKNDETLKHEQLHFDISQVVMNRFCDRIKNIKETTLDDLQSRIQYEYLEAFREMNRLQKAYDGETKHGTIPHKQIEWNVNVGKWLLE